MARNLEPKCKSCRREGVKLMLKGERCSSPKCAISKRNYPPGIHGPKGRGRASGYSMQLREKQKAKKIYNILEKQFKLTFDKAIKQKGDAGENLMKLLETRLDNVIFRLALASSRNQARQLVNHRHFTINGKILNIPSYQTKTGDIIKIKKSSSTEKHFINITEQIKKAVMPSWLNFDIKEMTAKVLHAPAKKDFEQGINTQQIVEFYSR
ncbi:30S ribosomal protein S4 [Patescibacteria group bacterium]|nr:30S ribosomal protein S4 [Patescibacteria group bacterium]MBU0879251.1 30S ribosomal protein S4 [Patescibacteria group bacterium]MBU0880468.1 30S ribosomal protein S4 [Patescibacteria group bacterium]MBU0897993.1 30S ribosomal protein S4 [Patescibacteria group bacterium]MBU1062582.1 30S ribosomal protein S4 [Patescibacteria group bacterium]